MKKDKIVFCMYIIRESKAKAVLQRVSGFMMTKKSMYNIIFSFYS